MHGLLAATLLATPVLSVLCGIVSYLQMMRTVPPAVSRQHAARLRVRENMLCFAAPELFVGPGATYRRRYIACLSIFAASLLCGAILMGAR